MIILATGKETSIVVSEKDIERGVKNFYTLYNNALYDPCNHFKPIEAGKHKLFDRPRAEYSELEKVATIEFDRRHRQATQKRSGTGGSELMTAMEKALAGAIAERSAAEILETVLPEVKNRIINEFGILPQKHEIVTPTTRREITGVTHEKFDLVLNLVNADIPCFLTGAAGTGKNVICKQIAEALGLEFYFTNAVTQEYKLTGFIDAHGTFHETEFYKAFKNGGLFFLDEMDASIPETLIVLNAAIANRYFDFPNGKINAHEKFRVIAAGNTYGTGADIEYSGRYQLDAASLDRFALVEVDYSRNIENALAGGDEELVNFAEAFRKATRKAGIKHLVTYRAVDRIAKLKDILPLPECMRIALLKGLEKDDINIVLQSCNGVENNRYYKAAKEAGTV